MRHGWGLHLGNPNNWQDIDVDQAVATFGNGCYTVLHYQMGVLPELRRRCPEALILVRCHLPDWYAVDPRQWALDCASIYRWCKPYTRHITFANEQDLAAESNGAVGATESRPISAWDYDEILKWHTILLNTFEQQSDTYDAITHFAALSGGHQADDGLLGYNILRPVIDRYQVLDIHLYPVLGVPVEDGWRGAARIDRTLVLFPTKPVFISECGNFKADAPGTPEHLTRMGYLWQHRPQIIGWTYFIQSNPTDEPGNEPNNMSRQPAIFDALRQAIKTPRGEEAHMPPEFVLGFRDKARQLGVGIVGEPVENEGPFTPDRYNVQQTTRGLMIYSKAGNHVGFIPFS